MMDTVELTPEELYEKYVSAVPSVPVPVIEGVLVMTDLQYAFAQAGRAHNPSLPETELEALVNHKSWVYRFLAAGNPSLSASSRLKLRESMTSPVAAAALFFEPGAGLEGMPDEWVDSVHGITKRVFHSAAQVWSEEFAGNFGFPQGWFSEFMLFRYPEFFPWGKVDVLFVTDAPVVRPW